MFSSLLIHERDAHFVPCHCGEPGFTLLGRLYCFWWPSMFHSEPADCSSQRRMERGDIGGFGIAELKKPRFL
jgi:hypothetical protein